MEAAMDALFALATELVGLLALLAFAGAVLVATLTTILVRTMVRPPRRGMGYALAHSLPTEPGDLGLASEGFEIERPDGVRLEGWIIEGDAPDGDGGDGEDAARDRRTAICLHGWGESRIDVLARLPVYLGLFDRFVLYDARGHGESGGRCALGEREVDDLLALLERFAKSEDEAGSGERLVVMGWSMGAVVGLEAVERWRAEHPSESTPGLISLGGYTSFRSALKARMRRAGYPAEPMASLALLWLKVAGRQPAEADLAALRDLASEASPGPPILWLQGSEDEVGLTGEQRRSIAVDGVSIDIRVIDGAHHLDLEHADTARVRAAVADCIERWDRP